MPNVMDYLDWRGDLSLAVSPFNEVDNYICCMIVTPDYTGCVTGEQPLSEVMAAYDKLRGEAGNRLGTLSSPHTVPMVRRLKDTVRFGDVHVRDYERRYDTEDTEQFSAVTVLLSDGSAYIAFCGTDDTLTGWKEDFLMSATDEVPAQRDALAYFCRVAESFSGPIRVGGHAKGGKLAVYAALYCPETLQKRILAVYNNDGPGFRKSVVGTAEYERIKDRLHFLLPQHSMVGQLLEQGEVRNIVESSVSGMWAHDGFNWQVKGTRFVRCEELSLSARAFGDAMASIQERMDETERRETVEALFDLLGSTGAETLTELERQSPLEAITLLRQSRRKPEVKEFLESMMGIMFTEYTEEIRESVSENGWLKRLTKL